MRDAFLGTQGEGNSLIKSVRTVVARSHGEPIAIRNEDAIRRSLEHACLLANLCDQYRGRETVVLDLTHITSLFDFFVITTGTSRRQLVSIAESGDDLMAAQGSNRLGREGSDQPWICHDYGDVVLHVFTDDGRKLYDLENLWGDAQRVDYSEVLKSIGVLPVL